MELSDAAGILSSFFNQQSAENEGSHSYCHLKNVQVQVLQCFWNSEGINNELQLWWVYLMDKGTLLGCLNIQLIPTLNLIRIPKPNHF